MIEKQYKQVKVIAKFTVEVPVYVVVEDEIDAVNMCEELFSDGNIVAYSNGSIGLEAPTDEIDDEDVTPIFEVNEDGYEGYDIRFELSDDEPDYVDLYFDEEDDDDI